MVHIAGYVQQRSLELVHIAGMHILEVVEVVAVDLGNIVHLVDVDVIMEIEDFDEDFVIDHLVEVAVVVDLVQGKSIVADQQVVIGVQ